MPPEPLAPRPRIDEQQLLGQISPGHFALLGVGGYVASNLGEDGRSFPHPLGGRHRRMSPAPPRRLFDLADEMKALFWQGSRAERSAGADEVKHALDAGVLEHPGIQTQQRTFDDAVDLLADRGRSEVIAPEHIPGGRGKR